MTAEASVADAIQGHRETARSHGFERGQKEALLCTRQADGDPALCEQSQERAPVKELRDQPMLDALRIQSLGQGPGKVGALEAGDRNGSAPRLIPRWRAVSGRIERRHITTVRDRQNRTVRPASGGDCIGDLLAHANPDRPLGEVTIELRSLMGVPNALDEVDSGIGQSIQAAPDQIPPVDTGDEEQIAVRWLPALGHDAVTGGPELLAFANVGSFEGSLLKSYPRCEARHPHNVLEVMGMLEMPAGQTHIVPVKPD